jgi:outer membrane lipoprotein-sorting protein
MRMISLTPFVLVAVAIAGCSSGPKTTEEVIQDINAKMAKVETYAADMNMAMSMGAMQMNFGGTVQGKDKQMVTAINFDMMNQKMSMKSVLDKSGIMWMDMDMMGQKQVMKMDVAQAAKMQEQMMPGMPAGLGGMGGGQQSDPRKAAETYTKMFALDFKGKEKAGDTEVYVLEGKLHEDMAKQLTAMPANGMDIGAMMSGARLKFGVKDGFQRSLELLDKDNKAWMTQSYSNIKLNEAIDDAVFTYTPAPGVNVMDMTQMLNNIPGQTPSAAPEAPKN